MDYLNQKLIYNQSKNEYSELPLGLGQSSAISLMLPRQFDLEILPGHPPELSDSVKLLLSDARRHGIELDQVLKSKD